MSDHITLLIISYNSTDQSVLFLTCFQWQLVVIFWGGGGVQGCSD